MKTCTILQALKKKILKMLKNTLKHICRSIKGIGSLMFDRLLWILGVRHSGPCRDVEDIIRIYNEAERKREQEDQS